MECKTDVINPYYYNSDPLAPLCDNCVKNMLEQNMEAGTYLWNQALERDQEYHSRAKIPIADFINQASMLGNLSSVAYAVRDNLVTQIKAHLQFYTCDSLVALCVLIKQRFLAGMNGASQNYWHSSVEFNVACKMIQLSYEIEEFDGGMLFDSEEPGMFDLITAIVFLRILLMLENNIKICKHVGYDQRTIQELLYKPIEWPESEKYFEEYVASGQCDKPEDYHFTNNALIAKLHAENKDINSITAKADRVIEPAFGFKLDVMMKIMMDPICKTINVNATGGVSHYNLVAINNLYKEFEKIANCTTVNRVIDTFTIRKVSDTFSYPLTEGYYELRSIVRFGNQALLVPYEMMQGASAFRGYALSGHNIELFSQDIGTQINLSSVQNLMSSFVVYTLVDVLLDNGYILPQEKKKIDGVVLVVPMAEIKKVLKNGINLLNRDENLIDIDILAYDENNKTILNIEVKHFKPAVSLEQMLVGDINKIEGNQVVKKTLAREVLIKNELESFLRFLNVPMQEGIKVKSFVVSSRPNYFAQLCIDVECITWRQFCARAKGRRL